jgi:plasmid stabilization system protein ParE
MVRINWTIQAITDLKNIYEFIACDSKIYAKNQVVKIKEKTQLLKLQPKLGRIVPELMNENIRELIFGNYRIIYRFINVYNLDIITIFHSSRIMNIKVE